MTKHEWSDTSTILSKKRRCELCGAEQAEERKCDWGRTLWRLWWPKVGRCKGLKMAQRTASEKSVIDHDFTWKYKPGRWMRTDGAVVERVTAGARKGVWRARRLDGEYIKIPTSFPPTWQGYGTAKEAMVTLDNLKRTLDKACCPDHPITRCAHRRQISTMETVQCSRPATRDGYCTRHHPSYISPATAKVIAAMDE